MYCYLLFSGNGRHTYIGATVDPDRRLRQHNGEITGGARRTSGASWTRSCYVSGFPTWVSALQFEWAWKRHGRGKPSLGGKLEALWNLIHSERSTGNALPFRFWSRPLSIVFNDNSGPILNKIDWVRRLQSTVITTMSTPDITTLALRVEELALQVQQLQNQLAARPTGATGASRKRGPKAVAAVDATATATATAAPSAATAEPKKRGPKKATAVPATEATEAPAVAPKKRGPKKATATEGDATAVEGAVAVAVAEGAPQPKKRGPKKAVATEGDATATATAAEVAVPEGAPQPKKRGPKKAVVAVPAPVADATPVASMLSSA